MKLHCLKRALVIIKLINNIFFIYRIYNTHIKLRQTNLSLVEMLWRMMEEALKHLYFPRTVKRGESWWQGEESLASWGGHR